MAEAFGKLPKSASFLLAANSRPLLMRVYLAHRLAADYGEGVSRRSVAQVARDLASKPRNVSLAERELEELGLLARCILKAGHREVRFPVTPAPAGHPLPGIPAEASRVVHPLPGIPAEASTPAPAGHCTPAPAGHCTPAPAGHPYQRSDLQNLVPDTRVQAGAGGRARVEGSTEPAWRPIADAYYAERARIRALDPESPERTAGETRVRELLAELIEACGPKLFDVMAGDYNAAMRQLRDPDSLPEGPERDALRRERLQALKDLNETMKLARELGWKEPAKSGHA